MVAEKKRILVTGATGFVGQAVVQELLGQGYAVRGLGRNLERGLELEALGAEFRPVDLRDLPAMIEVCREVDAVIHAGALASPWGRAEDFEAINVEGTANTILGCRVHGVKRLVYISSPSVTSVFQDQYEIDEGHVPVGDFVSNYSRTKWDGEVLVRQAHGDDLETVIIRPKAVYGPGDTQIIPRILKVADRGIFPQFGRGETSLNITFIDDVARGIVLAMESEKAGGNTYVLTGDEDVDIWEVVGGVLDRLGKEVKRVPVATGVAMGAASVMEGLWRLLPLEGEPPLTRYTVGIFAYSQTYNITAAKEDLGYEPRVKLSEGMEAVAKSFQRGQRLQREVPGEVSAPRSTRESDVIPRVGLEVMVAGVCTAPSLAFYPDGGLDQIEVPALFAVIDHPERGKILFDTGYSERFFPATQQLPARVFRWLTPAKVDSKTSAAGRLRARGIDPESIETILLSHFDPDHYGGLRDFPNATIICTAEAWGAVRGKTGFEALKARILPGHLPKDLTARLWLLPPFAGPAIGPFDASHDIFGDQSLRAVALPGHAPGQYGVFLETSERPLFLAADGCWTGRCLEEENPRGQFHLVIADDRKAQRDTYRRLRRLRQEMPDVAILPSHCPDGAREFCD